MADIPDILRPLSPRVLCVVCFGFLGGVKYFLEGVVRAVGKCKTYKSLSSPHY